MIRLISILLIGFLVSCGTPKELRRLKRGSKKMQKLVQKYPELLHNDTIRDTVSVFIPQIKIDTIFSLSVDTVYSSDSLTKTIFIKPPLHLEYEKSNVKVQLDYVQGDYQISVEVYPDTIEVPVETIVEVIQPVKVVKADFSKWQRFKMTSGLIFWILLIVFVVLFILSKLGKISIPFMILVMLLSCTKIEKGIENTYTIKQGNYKIENRKLSRVNSDHLWFHFTFTENHKYLSEIPDDQNRLDINKLYGLTSSKIHENSCRIGWREFNNGNFEVLGYWYLDGVRKWKHLYEAEVGELLEMEVTNFGDYRFYCNGEQFIIPAKEFNKSYRAWPFFGGQNAAPHDMYFKIKGM